MNLRFAFIGTWAHAHTMKSFWILNFHEMTLQHVLYKTNYIVINIESNCKLMLINTQELSQWTSVTVTVNFLSCVSYFLLLTLYPALSKITYKSILHVIDISHVSQKYIKNYCSFEFSSTDLQEKKHNIFFFKLKFFSKLSWIFLVPKLPLNLSSLVKVFNYFHEKWLRLLIQNLLTRCMIGIMDHTVFVAWFDLQGTISSFCMLFSVWKTLYNGILFLLLIRCIYKVGSLIGCKWNLQIFFHFISECKI